MEEDSLAKEFRWPLDAEKGKEVDSPLRASQKNQLCQCLSFSYPTETDFNFLNSETIRE